MKDKFIGLIKWQKAGFKNLLGNSCIKRRIRGIAIRDYQMSEYKKPFSPIQHCSRVESWRSGRGFYLQLPLIKPYVRFVSLRSSFAPEYGFPIICIR
jgi:hypothetical protein